MRKPFLDITGQRYGRLVAISRVERKGRTAWLCQCDCGRTKVVRLGSIRGGLTKSCGCIKGEVIRSRAPKHGHRRGGRSTPTLQSYMNAKYRCTNPRSHNWQWYGARGITMCQRWLDGFDNFLADMGEAPEGYTLERVDNELGYSPDNCRWATRDDQAKNRQTTIWVEYEGERMCLKDYAKAIGRSYVYLHNRVRYHGADPLSFERRNKTE